MKIKNLILVLIMLGTSKSWCAELRRIFVANKTLAKLKITQTIDGVELELDHSGGFITCNPERNLKFGLHDRKTKLTTYWHLTRSRIESTSHLIFKRDRKTHFYRMINPKPDESGSELSSDASSLD